MMATKDRKTGGRRFRGILRTALLAGATLQAGATLLAGATLVAGTTILVGSTLFADSALARGTTVEDVAKDLMDPCPNCKGKALSGCYCGPAMEARDEIQQMLDRGMTHGEIVDAFVEKYGDWIRAAPEKRGFALLGYFLPVLGVCVGAGGLVIFLRRAIWAGQGRGSETDGAASRHRERDDPEPAGAQSRPADPEARDEDSETARYRARLRDELSRLGG